MLSVGIIDEGIGGVYACCKLKQVICADYHVKVVEDKLPLGSCGKTRLIQIADKATQSLLNEGCDVIILSSIALNGACYKLLSKHYDVPFFGCEAPINHALTYTVTNVLAVGDKFVTSYINSPNVITCAMPEFPRIAETFSERKVVDYITDTLDGYTGQFDCIALANSSMNVYKNCFKQVFPNVQIFDSIDGTVRRLKKRFKHTSKDDSSFEVTDSNNIALTEKYSIFFE